MAYESLMKYASNEIGKLIENPLAEFKGNSKKSFLSRAEWTGHNVEAIELIYALHSAKVLNYGNIEIKEIVKLFEKMFNIKLDNSYRTFKDIQGRKTIKTKFLDNLKQALLKRLEDLDR
jgi:transposase